jgi:hypothetical protein
MQATKDVFRIDYSALLAAKAAQEEEIESAITKVMDELKKSPLEARVTIHVHETIYSLTVANVRSFVIPFFQRHGLSPEYIVDDPEKYDNQYAHMYSDRLILNNPFYKSDQQPSLNELEKKMDELFQRKIQSP